MDHRESALFELIEPHVASAGLELVEVALVSGPRRTAVRVVIHAERGVTLGDCTGVTRSLGAVLDASPVLAGSYVIEVSSPGTDRVLKDAREFDVFRGAAVHVFLGADSPEREFTGVVAGRSGEAVVVRREDGQESVIPWSTVAKARLIPEKPGRAAAGGKER